MKRNRCFICKEQGHFTAKCPKCLSSKLKACFEREEFQDDCSIVDIEDNVSKVYIVTDSEIEFD